MTIWSIGVVRLGGTDVGIRRVGGVGRGMGNGEITGAGDGAVEWRR